ncbi:MAG TPA: hypothetical protein VGR66_02715 [Candidatus Eisenbacteria bacterium]|nr:hypothetical protein [Candidatus Eisenbacteria bacterium]
MASLIVFLVVLAVVAGILAFLLRVPAVAAWFARLRGLDRRWIFVAVWVLVMIPLLFPLKLPIAPTARAVEYYEEIEKLKPGDIVLLSADYDPASGPELGPMLRSSLTQLCRHKVKIVGDCLWPGGPPLLEQGFNQVARDQFHYQYGVDYVNLGFKEGREAVILAMGNSIPGTFASDFRGTPVTQLPLMNKVTNLSSVKLLVNISAGYPGTKEWVQQASRRFNLKIISGCTAVSAPEYYAYLQSNQLLGLLGGMAGAAEYEKMTGITGSATKGMDAQSSVHLLIMLCILMGNLAHWAARRQGER